MWPGASPDFLTALRYPHVRQAKATHRNRVTGTVTDLPVLDGEVTVDATSRIRRTLSLTVPPQAALWDALDTPGGEIGVTQTIRFTNHQHITVPLGTFIVDQARLGYGPGDSITMECPDRWLKVQRNKFGLERASVASNAAWVEVRRLVEDCWSDAYPFPGWVQLDQTATAKVGALLWDDGDREAAVLSITDANGLEVFFDATGQAVLRKVPTLTDRSASVWTVNAGQNGVMLAADRTRDRSEVRNAVIVTTSATDVTFNPVEVKNSTIGDPLNVTGPLGYVPDYYSSPLIRNSQQARTAGLARLSVTLGTAKQLEMDASGNPALDARDVLRVNLPRTDLREARQSELHIIDSVTHPLLPDGTQHISTRSTRPSTDGA